MKIWHISDTHTYHGYLKVPEGVDMVIHSGDCSNPRGPVLNKVQVEDFIHWYGSLDIEHKVYVAGNHDTSIEAKLITRKDFEAAGIIYLENEDVTLSGIKIWGSPYTPEFGQWAFMLSRRKLDRIWQQIPEDVNIVVVHGPPYGIMDQVPFSSLDRMTELCGCGALRTQILKIQPDLFLSGHIHNNDNTINAGILKFSVYKTVFSNGSVVTDGMFGSRLSNGNLFMYKDGLIHVSPGTL